MFSLKVTQKRNVENAGKCSLISVVVMRNRKSFFFRGEGQKIAIYFSRHLRGIGKTENKATLHELTNFQAVSL